MQTFGPQGLLASPHITVPPINNFFSFSQSIETKKLEETGVFFPYTERQRVRIVQGPLRCFQLFSVFLRKIPAARERCVMTATSFQS